MDAAGRQSLHGRGRGHGQVRNSHINDTVTFQCEHEYMIFLFGDVFEMKPGKQKGGCCRLDSKLSIKHLELIEYNFKSRGRIIFIIIDYIIIYYNNLFKY